MKITALAILLLTTTVHAQPFAFHGDGATVTSIVDESGWCAARPDGPRVGSLVAFEAFTDYELGDGRWGGDAWVTINGHEYRIGVTYNRDLASLAGGASQGITTFGWTAGNLWLGWDGIPDPPDETGKGYPDCIMTLDAPPLVERIPGDANQDGIFDSSDLVAVFIGGEYEDAAADNSTWGEGDFTADRDFRTDDLVAALQTGRYEQPATAVASVPEPSAIGLLLVGLSFLTRLGASWCRHKSP